MPISPAIISALADGTGFFVTLVRVTQTAAKGGGTVAYALHTRDVVFEGITYVAAPFEPSKMSQASGVSVDNATINHILGDLFTRQNIKGGAWAGATVVLLAVDLNQLTEGPARAHFGRLGKVKTLGTEAQTEYRGLMQLLGQDLGDRSSRKCRYGLGDADCTLDLAAFTFTGTVVGVTNNQKITISVSKANDYFKYGKIRFTSGNNNGLDMEIINNVGTLITLFLPMPGVIQIGDAFDIIAGDDKTLSTCHNKFDNAVNHGGEDGIPSPDTVFKFPD